jgi:hypothetical protein
MSGGTTLPVKCYDNNQTENYSTKGIITKNQGFSIIRLPTCQTFTRCNKKVSRLAEDNTIAVTKELIQ